MLLWSFVMLPLNTLQEKKSTRQQYIVSWSNKLDSTLANYLGQRFSRNKTRECWVPFDFTKILKCNTFSTYSHIRGFNQNRNPLLKTDKAIFWDINTCKLYQLLYQTLFLPLWGTGISYFEVNEIQNHCVTFTFQSVL